MIESAEKKPSPPANRPIDVVQDVAQRIQAHYNQTPFPDYSLDRFNNREALVAHSTSFARILDRSIPLEASVIDVGTGTGQLSAFLSLKRKTVVGIDFSDASLNKAKSLKHKLNLESLELRKVDILETKQIDEIDRQFDYLLCLGVLHHTGDPYRAFSNILKLLKPGGHIALGLYNSSGRIPLRIRRFLAATVFRNNQKIKDRFIRMQIGELKDPEKTRGWWHDQYLIPHESCHSVGEVLKWFSRNGIEFIQTAPTTSPFDDSIPEISGMWNKTNQVYPWWPIRVCKQLQWIYQTDREGGYWITFGRKR